MKVKVNKLVIKRKKRGFGIEIHKTEYIEKEKKYVFKYRNSTFSLTVSKWRLVKI
jgi:hypothetical protein